MNDQVLQIYSNKYRSNASLSAPQKLIRKKYIDKELLEDEDKFEIIAKNEKEKNLIEALKKIIHKKLLEQ